MKQRTEPCSARRGSAVLIALIAAVMMAGLCAALLAMNLSTERSRDAGRRDQSSFYAAEAGLSEAYAQLMADSTWTPAGVQNLGPTSYAVAVTSPDPRTTILESTGTDGLSETRLQLVLSTEATGFFQFAAFGADGVTLDANAFIDSYDSAYGSYASQVQGGNDFARENGDIGSNADINLRSNTEVHGDASPGPGHQVNHLGPNSIVTGSEAPLKDPFLLPPIVVPPVASSGSMVATADMTVGPGDVRYDSFLMKGGNKLTIVGPARLIATDFTMKSNTDLVFDTTGGEIELYSTRNFVLESNSRVTTMSDSALDVTLFLDGNNLTKKPGDSLQLGSNADFIGAIYAPNAQFSLASNFNIYGSLMCGRLDLSSFGEIHFDEALLYDGYGATGELEVQYWGPLAKP
jgi:hypothetical protein